MKPFEQVVADHGGTVWRVCRAVVGPLDADDAWSETFLAALRAYPGLPEGSDVRAWLVTIAHRKAVDIHRARARRAVPVAEVPDHGVVEPASDEHDELLAAVARLPERQRLTVAYHHVAGLPYREVAELVGGTPEAARRAAADGVAALRRALGTTAAARPVVPVPGGAR
ncbi:RNA polymerase sigma factor [Cellulomonas sp. APG4]|uniref:RNA polymerase sigma factor n=1 Tax=Cellulomonas sp. APG4 TaxID=1538656 RepID=UPI00351B4FDF